MMVVRLCGLALSFGSQLFLARLLGATEYGVYVYVVTWCTLIAMLAKLGFDNCTLRYLPEYMAARSFDRLRGFMIRRSQMAGGLSLIGAVAVGLYATANGSTLGPNLKISFLIGALSIPVSTFLWLQVATLRASLRSVASQLPLSIARPALVALGALGLLFFDPEFLVGPVAVGIFLVASSLVLLGAWAAARGTLRVTLANVRPIYETASWCKISTSLMVPSMMLYAMNEMDILMVGALLDTRSAGIYAASARLATLVVFALNAVNVVIAPMISNLYHSGRLDELRTLISDAGRIIFFLSVPVAILLFVLSDQFLSFFGAGFDKGQLSLKILVVGQLFNALSGSVGFLLTMTGHHREAAWVIGLGVLLGFALNFLLIPRFGLEGAAIATVISMVFWNGMLVWLVRRRLNVNMFGFFTSFRA